LCQDDGQPGGMAGHKSVIGQMKSGLTSQKS
jgi:hypothetical protein